MKVRIKGRKDLKKLRAALNQIADDMERFGITHAARAAFYFTPVDEDGEVQKLYKDRRAFEEWTIESGYEAAADEYDKKQ
jgi:hypothetical protein